MLAPRQSHGVAHRYRYHREYAVAGVATAARSAMSQRDVEGMSALPRAINRILSDLPRLIRMNRILSDLTGSGYLRGGITQPGAQVPRLAEFHA